MRGYSTFPWAPELEAHNHMAYSHIQDTSWMSVLFLCRCIVSIFYSRRRLVRTGIRTCLLRCRSLARYQQCPPTGQYWFYSVVNSTEICLFVFENLKSTALIKISLWCAVFLEYSHTQNRTHYNLLPSVLPFFLRPRKFSVPRYIYICIYIYIYILEKNWLLPNVVDSMLSYIWKNDIFWWIWQDDKNKWKKWKNQTLTTGLVVMFCSKFTEKLDQTKHFFRFSTF